MTPLLIIEQLLFLQVSVFAIKVGMMMEPIYFVNNAISHVKLALITLSRLVLNAIQQINLEI